MMKRLLVFSACAVVSLSGCGVFGSSSTSEPTMPEGSHDIAEPNDPNSNPEIDKQEKNSPTFILRSNCSDGMKDCKQEEVILYHDSTTSDGISVDENLIDQYKEAERDSFIKGEKTIGKDNCGEQEIGVKVPEWDNKTIFFCEYDNGNEDALNLVSERVLKESGVLIIDPKDAVEENNYADGNA